MSSSTCILLISIAGIVSGGSSTDHVIGCPRTCFCNVLSHIVYCSRRGLGSIPDTLPAIGDQSTLWQVNLNGNYFRSRVIERANFSSASVGLVEHLYMSDCGIERIEVKCAELHGTLHNGSRFRPDLGMVTWCGVGWL